MAFRQLNLGTPHFPRIDGREFQMILTIHGVKVIHRSKYTATKCTCWDDITGQPDRFCPLCNNGWIYEERIIDAYIRPIEPQGRNEIADFITQAGPVQRYNHILWTYGHEGEKIAVGDTIIHPIDGIKFEHDVINVLTMIGTHGKKVYTRLYLMRKPYAETGETDPTKPSPIG